MLVMLYINLRTAFPEGIAFSCPVILPFKVLINIWQISILRIIINNVKAENNYNNYNITKITNLDLSDIRGLFLIYKYFSEKMIIIPTLQMKICIV